MAEVGRSGSFDDLANCFDLDDETISLLKTYDSALLETCAHTNLISRHTLADRWVRHYADSLQLLPLILKDTGSLLDIGSGAGFPGLILAILMRDHEINITLVDSVQKKARFLAETTQSLGLENVVCSSSRVEMFHMKQTRYDVITARAVTVLSDLLALAAPLLSPGGMLIFPKGRKAEEELTAARDRWRFEVNRVRSMTDPDATILIITQPEPMT